MPISEYKKAIIQTSVASAGVLVTALISWYVASLHSTITTIQNTISAHHGPEWAQIEKIVNIQELRTELKKLKSTLSLREAELNSTIIQLQAQNTAMYAWVQQNDKSIVSRFDQDVEGLAQITNRIPEGKLEATLNIAHPKSENFNMQTLVEVTNANSGLKENVEVRITSRYQDINHSNVILQLSTSAAKRIGLTEGLGVLKINVKNSKKERSWQTIDELVDKEFPSFSLSILSMETSG